MVAKMAEVGGRKRTFADAFELVVWDRQDIFACSCSEKSYRHVHCPCEECGGKATSRKVEIEHWKRNQLLRSNSRENSSFHESNMEIDSVGATEDSNAIFHSNDEELRAEDFKTLEPEDSAINSSENEDEIPSNRLEKTVVKAVLKALQLTENTKSSHHSFEDILNFGKELFCEGLGEECDMDIVNAVWPSSWEEAQIILKRAGYEDPREYYICFCRKKAKGRKSGGQKHVYSGKWDIMEGKKQTCKHCGRKGKIKYYYLGLETKIKLWCDDVEMCQKLMAHWEEKWILPARCPENFCNGVVSSDDIEAAPQVEGTEEKLLKVKSFLSVLANDHYFSLLKGQVSHEVMEDGEVQTKFWSGFHLVQNPTETIFLRLDEIKRKVMLYPNHFVVLDYSRPTTPCTPIVPCFPEKDDVVKVLGEGEEWFGQVTSVSERKKTC
ncbi:hypothetical protein ACROYT_G024530 [Oculina patagonica]